MSLWQHSVVVPASVKESGFVWSVTREVEGVVVGEKGGWSKVGVNPCLAFDWWSAR